MRFGPEPEDDDLFAVAALAFVAVTAFERGIEIRCFGLELRRAGIDHFIDPGDAGGLPFFIQGLLRRVAVRAHDPDDLHVAEPKLLGFAQQRQGQGIQLIFCQLFFHVADLLDLIEEPAVDAIGGFGDRPDGNPGHQRILDAEDPVPFGGLDIFQQLFGMHEAFAVITQADGVILQALAGFLNGFGKAPADGHHFADAFHLQSERVIGAFELIEIPARHFDDHIILNRLEIGGSGAGDLVLRAHRGSSRWPVWQRSWRWDSRLPWKPGRCCGLPAD